MMENGAMATVTDTGRAAWLAERRQGIGGSDAAGILGCSPWATPLTVWLDKTGRAEPKEETLPMRIGMELEDFVARLYCGETGRRVRRFTRMVHDGCFLGNFDRLVIPEGEKVASHMGEVRTDTLLECKTGSRPWDGEVPIHYQTQVQHYMGLVPALRRAHVAYLDLVSRRFEVHEVERDDVAIAAMQERLREWWDRYVARDEMPPPATEEDCRLAWARSNPGKRVTASAEVAAALGRYRDLSAEAKRIGEEMDAAKCAVCAAMGDAETLAAEDGTALATWRSAKDSVRVDWEAVARECGATDEQIAAHSETRPGARRFVLKAAKKATA